STGVVVAHPVHVESGLVVLHQHVLGQPLVEPAAGRGVAVAPGLVPREADVDDVVGVAPPEGMALLGADDVVGRGHDSVEFDCVGVVAEAGEGLEPRHQPMATRRAGALRESSAAAYSWSWI